MEKDIFSVDITKSDKNSKNGLKRASGHLNKVIKMIDDNASCVDVAQQLQAVINALSTAKRNYVHDHIQDLIKTMKEGGSKADKEKSAKHFKEIAKYL
jgi:uncharacterized protein